MYIIYSSPTRSIEERTIHQPKSIDVVITTPGALGRWSNSRRIDLDMNEIIKKINLVLLCLYIFEGFLRFTEPMGTHLWRVVWHDYHSLVTEIWDSEETVFVQSGATATKHKVI